jgi:Ssp1 endopeptidase immunity protein Rap1a
MRVPVHDGHVLEAFRAAGAWPDACFARAEVLPEMCRMRAWLVLLLAAALCRPCAAAYFVDGATLARWIGAYDRVGDEQASEDDIHDASLLAGYIQGVVDAGDGSLFCLSRPLEVRQVLEFTRQYLQEHRDQVDLPAAVLVGVSLFGPFPCNGDAREPARRRPPAATPAPSSR